MRAIPWAVGCYAVGILAARIVNGPEWFREEGPAVLLWPVIVMIVLADQFAFEVRMHYRWKRRNKQ